jgi:hypothetical protein
MNIQTGAIANKIPLGSGKSNVIMCVATSHGKERFFLAAEESVMMSNLKDLMAYSNTGDVPDTRNVENISVQRIFLVDSEECDVVSLSSTGTLSFWNKNVVAKTISLPSGIKVESCGLHASSGIFVFVSHRDLVVYSLEQEKVLMRKPLQRIIKEIRIETLHQKGSHSLFVALLCVTEELLGYQLNESSEEWTLKQLIERKSVTVIPNHPLQDGTDRLLVGSVDKTVVLSIKTGKLLFERHSESEEKVKDLMWFNPADPEGMGDQIAFLTEDSLHAGNEIWSSGLPFSTPLVMENFEFCPAIGRLAYLGTQTSEGLDHELGTLRPYSYSVLNIIQTAPSRRRLGTLDHDKKQILKWCILPTRRHLLSLTVTGLLRIWDLESLQLLGILPLPETFRTKDIKVTSGKPHPLVYLTDGRQVLVLKLWIP